MQKENKSLEERYIGIIKSRALVICLQEELDALADANPLFKHKLRFTANQFRKELEKEMEKLYATLHDNMVVEYNKLATDLIEGINDIASKSIKK